jgi:hypothetical protein
MTKDERRTIFTKKGCIIDSDFDRHEFLPPSSNKKAELAKGVIPSAARPSYLKTRRFLSPSLEGFGFIGSASTYLFYITVIYRCQLEVMIMNRPYNFMFIVEEITKVALLIYSRKSL